VLLNYGGRVGYDGSRFRPGIGLGGRRTLTADEQEGIVREGVGEALGLFLGCSGAGSVWTNPSWGRLPGPAKRQALRAAAVCRGPQHFGEAVGRSGGGTCFRVCLGFESDSESEH
jgi:hypothetical protein